MIYSCILNETTERSAQLAVWFDQAFKKLKKQKFDTVQIDKMINTIEDCNKKIDIYISNTSIKNNREIMKNKAGLIKILKDTLWMSVAITAGIALPGVNIYLGAIAGVCYHILSSENFSTIDFYKKLKSENDRALLWLKKEKRDIESGKYTDKKFTRIISGKQEGCIFESVEFV